MIYTMFKHAALVLALALPVAGALAQDTLQEMPRYDRYEKLRRDISSSVVRGQLNITWDADSKGFTYFKDGNTYRWDIALGKAEQTTSTAAGPPRGNRRGPDRGRQFDTTLSVDGKLKAVSRNRNVVISDADGKNEVAVTSDGDAASRIKYGIASWVYGEELGVREAMWWSPDGKKLAFYRFDEGPVKDYFIAMNQNSFQDSLDTEAYPKAGANNPIVGLLVYDLASKKTVSIDTKFADPSLGEYIYDVRWSPSGKELLFNRTNRKQNAMEFCAADPDSGSSRAVLREDQPQSWAENHPTQQFLKDGNRFFWSSEKAGYKNFYLADMSGKPASAVTRGLFDADRIALVDEGAKQLWYVARSGNNPYLTQLHRVGFDGKGDTRLTDPTLSHTCVVSPDGKHFIDIQQSVDTPPSTILRDASGKQIAVLDESNLDKFTQMNLRKTERFAFTAADGKTQCYGTIQFPSDYDSSKKYPVLVGVYGGPESSGGGETFQTPNPITEFGFLCVSIDGRGTNGRGKAFRDAVYGKLGQVEIDDQAAGVRALAMRKDVDGKRVGIYGTSYGGYASLICLLRYPDVFAVSVSGSSVTDWRNYDSIYTERYMGLPWDNENKAGYDAGSAMTYARNLKGKLMLYWGTADNNVHPSNTAMLVKALDNAGKQYDMQLGVDQGHSGINSTRMWEYFITHLIIRPPVDSLAEAFDLRKRALRGRAAR